jgi:hypothetical protein
MRCQACTKATALLLVAILSLTASPTRAYADDPAEVPTWVEPADTEDLTPGQVFEFTVTLPFYYADGVLDDSRVDFTLANSDYSEVYGCTITGRQLDNKSDPTYVIFTVEVTLPDETFVDWYIYWDAVYLDSGEYTGFYEKYICAPY